MAFSPAKLERSTKRHRNERRRKNKNGGDRKWIPWTPLPGPQTSAIQSEAFETLYGGAAGSGKGQRCSTHVLRNGCALGQDPCTEHLSYEELLEMEGKVLTPKGFVPISRIVPGQQVCNPDGTVSRVIAVHDNGPKQFYRLTFIDGATVDVDEDHLWGISLTRYRYRRKIEPLQIPEGLRADAEWNLRYRDRYRITTTKELAALFAKLEDSDQNILIPLTEPPVQTAVKGRWPVVPPYTLGVLLGDGCVAKSKMTPQFTTEDFEIIENVQAEVEPLGYEIKNPGNRLCFSICQADRKDAQPFMSLIKRVGCYGKLAHEKSIPEYYKHAPVEVRLALFQGLMDTDGTIGEDGMLEFVTSSRQLAVDVQYLARSLGFKATLSDPQSAHYRDGDGEIVECRNKHRLYLRGRDHTIAFRLTRKIERVKPFNGGDVWPGRRLTSIEPAMIDYSRCITVDNPNGLYITDDFIVTHNSALLILLATRYHKNSIIFRRVYPNLKEMVFKSKELLRNSGASYNSIDKLWTGIPGDRTLEFGALKDEDTKYNYKGRPHDLKAFDEITEIPESRYEYVCGWTRTHIKGQRTRIIATCNPPSDNEGIWVRKRWAPWVDKRYKGTRALPGEIRWFTQISTVINGIPVTEQDALKLMPKGSLLLRKKQIETDSGMASMYEFEVPSGDPILFKDGDREDWLEPVSRTFIPGTLVDNPYIDSTYRRTLMALPEPLRSQLLYGDWMVEVETADEHQLVPKAWVRLAQERWTENPPLPEQSALGVDVARGGQDNTVIAPLYHLWCDRLKIYPGGTVPSGKDSAQYTVQALKSNDCGIYVDTVGVGSSCYDFLIDWGQNAYSCNAGGAATRMDRNGVLEFANLRAQWSWNLRELFDPENGYPIAIPPDDFELEEELTIIRWFARGKKIYVESRDDLIKADRLGRSPDRFSALMLALSDFTE